MDDEEISELIRELFGAVQEAQIQIHALCELAIERKLVSEEEWESRIADVRREEDLALQMEAKYRALRKLFESMPKRVQ
jgi:hypothetical protein